MTGRPYSEEAMRPLAIASAWNPVQTVMIVRPVWPLDFPLGLVSLCFVIG